MTTCVWCGSPFSPRATGGKPQRFCGESCRREFWQKLREWALLAVDTGLLPVEALKRAGSNGGVASAPNGKRSVLAECEALR